MGFLVALMASGCDMSAAPAGQRYVTEANVHYVWLQASGPSGQQDPSALPLFDAVFAGDQMAVLELLDRGVSPNALLYPKRWSPLIVAIALQDRPMIDLLIKRGADINYISDLPLEHTPLQVALFADQLVRLKSGGSFPENYIPMVDYIIDKGADINLEYPPNQDIAITAASNGNMKLVNELLKMGYRRDLVQLRNTLTHFTYNQDIEVEKKRTIESIDHLLEDSLLDN